MATLYDWRTQTSREVFPEDNAPAFTREELHRLMDDGLTQELFLGSGADNEKIVVGGGAGRQLAPPPYRWLYGSVIRVSEAEAVNLTRSYF